MNRFRKLDDGTWGVQCEGEEAEGTEVEVTRRDGTTERLVLGEWVSTNEYGEQLYRIARSLGGKRAGRLAPSAPANKPMFDDEVPF